MAAVDAGGPDIAEFPAVDRAPDPAALVATPSGIVAVTHLWSNRSGGAQPYLDGEPAALHEARLRVLGVASRIIPAHGPAFRAGPDTPV